MSDRLPTSHEPGDRKLATTDKREAQDSQAKAPALTQNPRATHNLTTPHHTRLSADSDARRSCAARVRGRSNHQKQYVQYCLFLVRPDCFVRSHVGPWPGVGHAGTACERLALARLSSSDCSTQTLVKLQSIRPNDTQSDAARHALCPGTGHT